MFSQKKTFLKLLSQTRDLTIDPSRKTFISHYNLLRQIFLYQNFFIRHFYLAGNIFKHFLFLNNILNKTTDKQTHRELILVFNYHEKLSQIFLHKILFSLLDLDYIFRAIHQFL